MATLNGASALVGPTPAPPVRPVSLAVKRYLENYNPEAVVVGVSGGADSLALAVATVDLAGRRQIPCLLVTIDHQMRSESALEAQHVGQVLTSLGGDHRVVKVEVAAGGGPEGSAREARQAALSALAPPGADILLGHTLDDQAETVLLRLGKGASLRSLAAMAPRRAVDGTDLNVGRPLLSVRRRDTVAFCEALGLAPVFDPSNAADGPWRSAKGEALPRAALRERVIPALSAALDQEVSPALARVAQMAAADEEALEHYGRQVCAEATLPVGEPSEALVAAYDPRVLTQAPAAVRRRALRHLLLECGARNLNSANLGQVEALLVDWHGQGSVNFGGGVRASRRAGVLVIESLPGSE